MPLFDVRCIKCQAEGECMLESGQGVAQCGACGGYAHVVWKRFGGMMGKNKGIFPQYDTQLGMTLESTQHRDRVMKERGLTALSVPEYNRTLNNQHEPTPTVEGNPEFVAAMEKAYYEIEHGMVPIEPTKTLDPANGTLMMGQSMTMPD